MNKPNSLRAALIATLPSVAKDPQTMSVYVDRGRLKSSSAAGTGWEYAYQVTVIIQDFAEDVDVLANAVIAWARTNQPDILANPELRQKSIRFECELMTNELVDVSLEIDLTEAVLRSPDGKTFEHLDEPGPDPSALY